MIVYIVYRFAVYFSKNAQSYYIFRKHARKNAKIFDIFAFLAVLVILGECFFAKKHKKKETSV